MTGHQNGAQAAPSTTGAASPRSGLDPGQVAALVALACGRGVFLPPASCPSCGLTHSAYAGTPLITSCPIYAEQLAYVAASARYEDAKQAVEVARNMLALALEEREDAEDDLAEHEAKPGIPMWSDMAAKMRAAKQVTR